MNGVLTVIWHGLRDAFLMGWEVWWALVIGFAISAVVQACVPPERVRRSLGGGGPRAVSLATALGAASSSCSYAAVAIAKSLFQKGASAVAALAFQLASTNLVWELGLVLWVLIGWQFTLAEYLGGVVMIVLIALCLRLFVSEGEEARAREHAQTADHAEHDHHHGGGEVERRKPDWRGVPAFFIADWRMLWKEITVGFLLAGFAAQIPNHFFGRLFLEHAPEPWRALENVVVGPVIAILSFVCSVGNVPLAAVLWSGGISFGGVLSFLLADLIVLPIIAIYRKYYGSSYAVRITALMFVTIVIAALVVSALFGLIGAIPTGARPTRHDVFGTVALNYKLVLNVIAAVLFAAMIWVPRMR